MIKLESTNTIYSELFNITFEHNSYQTPLDRSVARAISVVPDENTKQLFMQCKISYRFVDNVLICFVESSLLTPPAPNPKVPVMQIDNSAKIRFLVKNAEGFFDKTFVTTGQGNKIYQFSNKNVNTSGTDSFLTAPVETFNPANDYTRGTIVQNGVNLFGAHQNVLATSGIPLTDTNFWQKITPLEQVVSNADLEDATIVQADDDCLAVIDMFKSVTTAPYNFFDPGDKLLNPPRSFKIKFASTFKF
jgi:hypothetical protein